MQPGPTNIIRLTGGNGGVNVDYLTFTPIPAGPWNAQIQNDALFGVQTNQFGFVIGDNWTYVVEATTDLANLRLDSVATNTIIGINGHQCPILAIPIGQNNYGRFWLRSP